MKSILFKRFLTSSAKYSGNISVLCMPQLSPTMTGGKITKWYGSSGQKIKEYELICEISTETLTQIENYEKKDELIDIMEVEIQEDVYIAHIFDYANTVESDILVGKPIALLCEEYDDITKLSSQTVAGNLQIEKFPRALWQAYTKTRVNTSNCGCM